MRTLVGSGSVAHVYILAPNALLAFKVAADNSLVKIQQLSDEFENAIKVYNASQKEAKLFRVLAPIALFAKDSSAVPKLQSVVTGHVANQLGAHNIDDYFLQLDVDKSTFALERIPPLPPYLCNKISQRFPFLVHTQSLEMCRIYLTKVPSDQKICALDPDGYMDIQVATQHLSLPSLDTIAGEMGKTLARTHLCGLDGRGIKFVLGGSTTRADDIKDISRSTFSYTAMKSAAPCQVPWGFYVLSFEETKKISDDHLHQMTMAYFGNFPYFPTPSLKNELYNAFKDGYFEALASNEGFKETAIAFFELVEFRQHVFPYSSEKFEEAGLAQEEEHQQSSQEHQQSAQELKASDPKREQASQRHESLPMEQFTRDMGRLHDQLADDQSLGEKLKQYSEVEKDQRFVEAFPAAEFLHTLITDEESGTRQVDRPTPYQMFSQGVAVVDGYEVRLELEQKERKIAAKLALEQEAYEAEMEALQAEQLREYIEKKRQHEEEMELMYPTDPNGGLYGPPKTTMKVPFVAPPPSPPRPPRPSRRRRTKK